MMLSDVCLSDVCSLSVCRTEVAHVTRDSDTTSKVKRSTVNLLLVSYIANLPGQVPPDE